MWQDVLSDLDARFEASERAELGAEVGDRTRRETALLRIGDRLRALVGSSLACQMVGGLRTRGRCTAVGAGWLLIDEGRGREVLVPTAALTGVLGGSRAVVPAGLLAQRLDLALVLRGIARDRSEVTVWTVDGSDLHGTIDRVGGDFLDLAEHPAGEARRRGNVSGIRMVPTGALSALQRG